MRTDEKAKKTEKRFREAADDEAGRVCAQMQQSAFNLMC